HGAVADPGVEHAHRRWSRVNVGEFEGHPVRHHPLFTASVHEQEIFLAIVEEAKIALRITGRGGGRGFRHDAAQARGVSRARSTAAVTAWVPSAPPNSQGLRPEANAQSTAASIRCAASVAAEWLCRSPSQSSIIAADRIIAVGLARPLPMISGAVP